MRLFTTPLVGCLCVLFCAACVNGEKQHSTNAAPHNNTAQTQDLDDIPKNHIIRLARFYSCIPISRAIEIPNEPHTAGWTQNLQRYIQDLTDTLNNRKRHIPPQYADIMKAYLANHKHFTEHPEDLKTLRTWCGVDWFYSFDIQNQRSTHP